MASRTLVKNYVAQWMQMGKGVSLSNYEEEIHIYKILQGEKYSPLFNELWEQISTTKAEEAHLSGTDQSIGDLLSNHWEIIACARCDLLVPSLDLGARVPVSCPCDGIPNHPNLDSVAPHNPVTLIDQISNLKDRLAQKSINQPNPALKASDDDDKYASEAEDVQTICDLKNSMLKLVKTQL
jgi:hypothetical protein